MDIKLWKRFKKGDKVAFRAIFDKYSPILYHYGLSYLGNKDFIEDCIHELFLNLWESKESVADVESVKYYLIVSFRRTISRQQALIKRRSDMYEEIQEMRVAENEESIQEIIIDEQIRNNHKDRLNQAIHQLPDKQRQAVVLRFMENKEYDDIVKIMSISYQNARKYVYLGIKKLRTSLSDLPIHF